MVIGMRVNTLVGAGEVAALSVAVQDSKFGIPLSSANESQILEAFVRHGWLNCVHVHIGSGGMARQTLVTGIRAAFDFARRVNARVGRRQVTVLDIGGGLPVNYSSDAWRSDKVPTFAEYAEELRREIPGLLAG